MSQRTHTITGRDGSTRTVQSGTDPAAYNAIAGGNAGSTANSLLGNAQTQVNSGLFGQLGERSKKELQAAAGSASNPVSQGAANTTSAQPSSAGTTAGSESYDDYGDDMGDEDSWDEDMTLIFPSDLGASHLVSSYMSFQPFKIVGGFGSKRDRTKDYERAAAEIFLPMPPNMPEAQYANDWGEQPQNAFKTMMGTTAASEVGRAGVRDLLGAGTGAATGFADAIQNQYKEAEKFVVNAYNAGGLGGDGVSGAITKIIAAGLGEAATGVIGQMVGQGVMQATGVATFEESSMVYGGPGYRQFTFGFKMIPGTVNEANNVNNIVKRFKEFSTAHLLKANMYRIYEMPSVWEIKYYWIDHENIMMNKILMSELANMSVKYGGDRFATYTDGTPVQTELTLQFKEIELINQELVKKGY